MTDSTSCAYFAFVLLLFIALTFSSTVPTSADDGERSTFSPESLRVSEKYLKVMRKMEAYCEQPYNETDDKIIDMYTRCFANLIQADKELVSDCRIKTFGSTRELKMADCSKEFTPKSLEIRNCITDQMTKSRDAAFQFRDGNDSDDFSTQLFLDCMDLIL